VVAVDPAAKKNEVADEGAATGIVVAAIGEDGRGYVLDDATCRESPNGWARMAVACFDRYEGDCVVGEVNNGGDMVESTIRVARNTIPFKRCTPLVASGPGPSRSPRSMSRAG
jgi:phage terminase large subunit-like protein